MQAEGLGGSDAITWQLHVLGLVCHVELGLAHGLLGLRLLTHRLCRKFATCRPNAHQQGKLAEMKVDKAMESVNRVARRSNEPGLRRVSQDLNLVRNSIKLARASMGAGGGALFFWFVCSRWW